MGMRRRMGRLVHFYVLSLTARCRTWSDDVALPPASLEVESHLDPDSPWAPVLALQAWELPSMQQLQVCFLDWVLLPSQGKVASRSLSTRPVVPDQEEELFLLFFCYNLRKFNNKMST